MIGGSNPSSPAKSEPKKAEAPKKTEKPAEKQAPAPEPEAPQPVANGAMLDAASWPKVLEPIRKGYSTLYSILKSADVTFEPGLVRLTFERDFYRKRANDAKNKQIIIETIRTVTGKNAQVECTLADKTEGTQTKPAAEAAAVAPVPTITESVAPAPVAETNDSIENISNIFGGAELLES